MNNKLPQINFIYDRRKIASPTRKSAVEMLITYDYKRKYLSTGIMLYSHQWKNGMIVDCPDILQVSQILDKMLKDVRGVIVAMMEEGHIDIMAIPDRLRKEKLKNISFLDYCKMRATIRKYGKKKDTQQRYDRFIRLFEGWGKIRRFEDVTEEKIILYDKYLISRKLKPYSKWNNYHRFIDSFIIDAIEEGYLKRNPYKWLNIPRTGESLGLERCLTPDEFRRLKTVQMPTMSLERVKDLFIFQTYTCLRYSDLRRFDSSKVQEVKGMPVYLGNSIKTGKPFTIPLLSPALDILHKYEGRLPVISNVKYNLYLKTVAQTAGIDKPLSTHWARHTGSTILLNEGIDIRIVSKICGHSSTRITEQVYAKLLDETVVDAVQRLE